jgi:hypothetical protein
MTVVGAYGNPVTDYAGGVRFTGTDPLSQLSLDYTFTTADQGTHSFVVTWPTMGQQTRTITGKRKPASTGNELFSVQLDLP